MTPEQRAQQRADAAQRESDHRGLAAAHRLAASILPEHAAHHRAMAAHHTAMHAGDTAAAHEHLQAAVRHAAGGKVPMAGDIGDARAAARYYKRASAGASRAPQSRPEPAASPPRPEPAAPRARPRSKAVMRDRTLAPPKPQPGQPSSNTHRAKAAAEHLSARARTPRGHARAISAHRDAAAASKPRSGPEGHAADYHRNMALKHAGAAHKGAGRVQHGPAMRGRRGGTFYMSRGKRIYLGKKRR